MIPATSANSALESITADYNMQYGYCENYVLLYIIL